ncbi:MAG: hypothetical protein CL945_15960 [Dinoroseobacter sp.]|nr:hypothetical protein [Dinoroseobacter sp.]
MNALEIISAPPVLSVQDTGRTGFRRFGVALSGAMDQRALALANALVGNALDAAALELAYGSASFRAVDDPLPVALVGPGAVVELAGRVHAEGCSVVIAPGVQFTASAARDGVFSYLAVAGGIQTPLELGSRSFHLRSGIGGPALAVGDHLPCAETAHRPALRLPEGDWRAASGPIRFVPGPQQDRFTKEAQSTFASSPFTIGHRSDRMALRLGGPFLSHSSGHDIVSDGVLPGSIQVPGDGQPIVLMRDCQTTGGYPKIGTVISADLDRLAQCPPGTAITFKPVTQAEAIAAARSNAAGIARIRTRIQPAPAIESSAYLLSQNLIGGVVSGSES